jgi:hypothetical protein
MMNQYQEKFLELAVKKESTVKQLKEINRELSETMRMMPLGEMFQDPKDKVVYQVIAPSGTYVEFKTVDYIRTRKEGEEKGTLSIKAAQEAGFSPSIPGDKK